MSATATVTATKTAASAAVAVIDPNVAGPGIVGDLFHMLAQAYRGHQWVLLAGLALTLVIVILRFTAVTKHVPDAWVPWMTMAIATGSSIAIGLQTGQSWSLIVTTGLTVGVTAIGGWETLGKLLRDLLQKTRKGSGPAPEDRSAEPPVAPVAPLVAPPLLEKSAPAPAEPVTEPSAVPTPPADPPAGV